MNADEAYTEVQRLTRQRARNFAYGIMLLPGPKRRALAAVYAFAREVDDIADEPGSTEDKRRRLEELRAAIDGEPDGSAMLVTLAENAIKHGLGPMPEGGRIAISARVDRDRLELCVADSGRGFTKTSGAGTGLANIRARLAALYGATAQLRISSNHPRGIVAAISLPYAGAERITPPNRIAAPPDTNEATASSASRSRRDSLRASAWTEMPSRCCPSS